MKMRFVLCVLCCVMIAFFVIPQNAQAKPETAIPQDTQDSGLFFTGIVIDEQTKKPIIARFEFELQPSNILVIVDSSDATGAFAFELPYLARYLMKVTSDEYFPVTELVGFDRYAESRGIERTIMMKPLKPGAPIELRGVEFETGSAKLTVASRPALQQIRQVLAAHPELYEVVIEGFTDNVGEWDANLKLSQARAESVRDWLIEAGIPAGRFTARGNGEAMPAKSNDTPEGRRANRRVEILFMDPAMPEPRHK